MGRSFYPCQHPIIHVLQMLGHWYTVHAFSNVGFHATPSRPDIWYDNKVLEAASAAQLVVPLQFRRILQLLQWL